MRSCVDKIVVLKLEITLRAHVLALDTVTHPWTEQFQPFFASNFIFMDNRLIATTLSRKYSSTVMVR
jgi:hypothetical protein